jgi:hypothetical protein
MFRLGYLAFISREKMSEIKLVWVGGYPAHYVGEFHCRLEDKHRGLFFIYLPLSPDGRAFTHENTRLPSQHVILNKPLTYYRIWALLCRLNPKAVLIAGHFPRSNMVAALWAISHNRDLYYLSDSNKLDRRNAKRGILGNYILCSLLRRTKKILCIGSLNKDYYTDLCGADIVNNRLHHFPLPHNNIPY